MTRSGVELELLESQLVGNGLHLRGGFRFGEGAGLEAPPNHQQAVSCLLVGNIGGSIWPHFTRWLASQPAIPANPMDRWTQAVISPLARRFGANAVYPFEKPYAPFQRWAHAAEGLWPSPLGILIHPEYGLWHAYRAALLFEQEITFPELHKVNHPCSLCIGKPCLNSCPADAVSESHMDVVACRKHLDGIGAFEEHPRPNCMVSGCFARNACPVGENHRYPADQLQFHMAAFTKA